MTTTFETTTPTVVPSAVTTPVRELLCDPAYQARWLLNVGFTMAPTRPNVRI